MQRHRSSAVPLAWAYAAIVGYASLYPFTGWRVPGVGPLDFLLEGWPRWWTGFDVVANLLGYLPLGFLLFVAMLRGGRLPARSALLAIGLGTSLSLSCELLQNLLPQRVASNVDLGLNVAGTALGVAIGAALQSRGGIERWQRIRERWFVARSAGGTALLVLWPVGLLFPTAVPFGLGQVFDRVAGQLAEWLQGSAFEGSTSGWLGEAAASSAATGLATVPVALPPAAELAIIVLGLLVPCLVAFTVAVAGWRRAALVLVAVAVGCAATTLSTALNFGPEHALSWTTPLALQGVAVGGGAALLLSLVPARVAAGVGLIAITVLVMLVARAPADPYFAQSLQDWEQGRFIRFHGAAQWVGWAWPYAAMVYLLVRLGMRGPRRVDEGF